MNTFPEISNPTGKVMRRPSFGQMCRPSNCSLLEDVRHTKAMVQQLRAENSELQEEREQIRMQLEHAEGNNRKLREMLFGSNSQHVPSKTQGSEEPDYEGESLVENDGNRSPKRRRGAQPGHRGKGRKIPRDLDVEEVVHDIPADNAVCPVCGQPYAASGFCEESFEIAMEIRFFVKKHIRKRMFRSCGCEQAPRQLTASKPANIIPKGLYDHSVLAFLLFGKYGMQVALTRLLGLFAVYGLPVNDGTIAGIFKKLTDILHPLYLLLQEQLQKENVLYIDETGFRHFHYPEVVSIPDEQQPGKFTWLWVFSGQRVTIFTVEPTRSSQTLEQTLGLDAQGIIVSDGAGAYRKFASQTKVLQSRCWAHFRRHFQDCATKFPALKDWAGQWLDRIAELYILNARRLKTPSDSATQEQAQTTLEHQVELFQRQMIEESRQPEVHPEAWKVLTSGLKYWEAYTVFVNHPDVAMDNNLAERNLRPGVLGRHNWYGVHASWSGTLTAMMMSCIQTAQQHGLNPIGYLHYVLDTSAQWQGEPRDLAKLLPWNIDAKTTDKYSMKTGSDPP